VKRGHMAFALTLLASINALGFMDRVMIALVAEKIKAEFSVTDFEIGLLGGTAFAVVNALASVPIARLAERWKRAYVSAGFLMLASVFTALAGFTTTFVQLLLCRIGMAAGNAATEAPPHSMISDMYPPEKRSSAISIFMLGVPVAALLGSFVGGMIAEQWDWRQTFQFFGVLGALVAFACFIFLKEPERATQVVQSDPLTTWAILRRLLGTSVLRYTIVGVALISLGSFGINTFLPAFFSRSFGLGAGQAGLAFGVISGLASLAGTLIGGFGSDYMARRDPRWLLRFPALGIAIGVPIFLLGLMSASLTVAIALMLIGSLSFYTVMGPAISTLHASLDSFSRATGSALFLLMVYFVGQGIGPPLVGLVSDTASGLLYQGGDFAARCQGAAAQVPGSACALASAGGLRWAIAAFAVFFIGGGLALWLASRGSVRDQL